MRQILIMVCALAFSSFSQAQIQVSEYEKSFKVDAHNVPAPNVSFTSDCGKVNVDVSEKMASGGCIGNLIRTYTASDECGNKATAEQYLSLQDTTGPELIGVPDDIYVDEKNIPEAPVVGARDLGDQTIKVVTSEERNENKLIRTFTATDKCGNTTVKQHTITFTKGKS